MKKSYPNYFVILNIVKNLGFSIMQEILRFTQDDKENTGRQREHRITRKGGFLPVSAGFLVFFSANREIRGLEKGKIEGKLLTVMKILNKKFKTLPSDVEDQISGFDMDSLDLIGLLKEEE